MFHLRKVIKSSSFLTNSLSYQYYIHLKDHNKKINQSKDHQKLAYMNALQISQNVPQNKKYQYKLRRRHQQVLDKQLFQQYKQKILQGTIDQQVQKQIDPLWGQQQKPNHYYDNFSYVRLLTVSHPKSNDTKIQLHSLFTDFFSTSKKMQNQQDFQKAIQQQKSIQSLVQISLQLKKSENKLNTQLWYQLQKKIQNKIYSLSTQHLLKLKFSFDSVFGAGTPQFKRKVNDLLFEDLQLMSKQNLIRLFYCFKNQQSVYVAQTQEKIIELLKKSYYQTMTIQQKINWLYVYAFCRKSLTAKPLKDKLINQDQNNARRFIYQINSCSIKSKDLTFSLCKKIISSLSILKVKNAKFILMEVQEYLMKLDFNNLDPKDLYFLQYYLSFVQDMEGFSFQIMKKIYNLLIKKQNWSQLKPIQQIRCLHSFWSNDMWSDQLNQFYRELQITSDSSMLYYFCQLQRQFSSQREWQVLRCIAQLQYIPLPYYLHYYRFANYMASCTDWDLQPIFDKLSNTAPFYNSIRWENNLLRRSKFFRQLKQYIRFGKGDMKLNTPLQLLNKSQFSFPLEVGLPINNLQFVMFADAQNQIAVDFVNASDCIPGIQKLKPNLRQKSHALRDIGWKHVYFHQDHIKKLTAQQKILQVLAVFNMFKEQQKAVFERQNWQRSQVLKRLRQQNEWNILYGQEKQMRINNPQKDPFEEVSILEKLTGKKPKQMKQ